MEHGIGNLADLGNDSRAILVLKLNILHEIQISRQGPVDFSTSLLVSTSYSVRSLELSTKSLPESLLQLGLLEFYTT